ncbi:helix-turn-helix domain-containing protein [Winogradskyella aurantiaca]|uniref:helix-turn-helix domain-containing protein n=1 Tax=Winogradskyella aurantiaca TaxID=2219558 RepID=UPI000E1C96E5|nr:helix-turn-helix domain-containing protein [Winogradskyella aurantiaca]
MDKNQLAIRIKQLRKQKGMSQEFLADESGLSLRTVQRIENGESNPTGDSLKKLSNALNVNPDELIDWSIKEDPKFLTNLNLSALTFLVFPLLGILIPFVLWIPKKGKVKRLNQLGRELINFQITWTLALFLIPILLFVVSKMELIAGLSFSSFIAYVIVLYIFNLILIMLNTIRIGNNKSAIYKPQISFLK